jgi:hypothetical protein
MSSSSTPTTEASKPSFLKQWGVLIAFAFLAIGTFVGFRIWTENKATAPVVAEYAGFVTYLAEQSTDAREYLQTYHRKFSRNTVASQHFEQVCGVMHRLAIGQGVEPAKYSEQMSRGCEQFSRAYVGRALPE